MKRKFPHLSPLVGTMLFGETRNTTWPLGSHTPGKYPNIKSLHGWFRLCLLKSKRKIARALFLMAPNVYPKWPKKRCVKSCQEAKRSQAQRHNGYQKNTFTLANRLVVTILRGSVDSLVQGATGSNHGNHPKYCQQILNKNHARRQLRHEIATKKPALIKEGSQKSTPPRQETSRNQRKKAPWCAILPM